MCNLEKAAKKFWEFQLEILNIQNKLRSLYVYDFFSFCATLNVSSFGRSQNLLFWYAKKEFKKVITVIWLMYRSAKDRLTCQDIFGN